MKKKSNSSKVKTIFPTIPSFLCAENVRTTRKMMIIYSNWRLPWYSVYNTHIIVRTMVIVLPSVISFVKLKYIFSSFSSRRLHRFHPSLLYTTRCIHLSRTLFSSHYLLAQFSLFVSIRHNLFLNIFLKNIEKYMFFRTKYTIR